MPSRDRQILPLPCLAVIVIAGEMFPGFGPLRQYISEPGERGSNAEVFMRYGGFITTGLLHVVYVAAVFAMRSKLSGSGQTRMTLLVAWLIALNGIGWIGVGRLAREPGCTAPEIFLSGVGRN